MKHEHAAAHQANEREGRQRRHRSRVLAVRDSRVFQLIKKRAILVFVDRYFVSNIDNFSCSLLMKLEA